MVKKAVLSGSFLLSLTVGSSSAWASNGFIVKFNNVEFLAPKESKMDNGQLLVPIRWVADELGANVSWDEHKQEVEVQVPESRNLKDQIRSLSHAISSTDPKEVVNTWIKGVKKRSGALQYAMMSPELQKATYQEFSQNFWITGGSSPKMANEQLQEEKISDDKMKYTLNYDLKTSGGIVGKGNRSIIVEKDGHDYWWVTAVATTDKSDVWLSPGVKVIN